MAKKTKHTIDVNAKSGPGFKKVAIDSKKAGQGLDKASSSAAKYNRNMKGASKQSSGASKNFSKMSQGMGGIVGAYATLAANIFAIGAAFRFLQSAGDLQKMKEGQELYAAATGTALRSLTSDIIAATDAQVTFSDASQAAAIGTAAGLTNDQLVALGKGAKDVSIILGRDVTDSFNRLVRGVTKAEPELLDELGIILRLADASEKYGTMIGKSANDLTQYEKSQAVTVEVMGQLESKYGRIMAVMAPEGNQFTKLGVAFDNIVNKIKEVAMVVAGPIADVLTKVPALAMGIMAAFANSLIRTSMSAWAERAAASAVKLGTSYKKAENRLRALQRLRRMKLKGQEGWSSTMAAKKADKGLGGITSKGAVAGPALDKLRAGEKLSKAEIRAARAVVQRKKGLDKEMKRSYIAALTEMEMKTKTTTEEIKIHFTVATSKLGLLAQKTAATWKLAMSGIAQAGAWAAQKLTMVMGAISWISMLATLGAVIYQFFKVEEVVDETAKELSAASDKVNALNEEFKHFNEIQGIIIEDGQGFLQYFEALGNRIGSLTINMQKSLMDNFMPEAEEMLGATRIREAVEEIDTILHAAGRGAIGDGGDAVTNRIKLAISQYEGMLDKIRVQGHVKGQRSSHGMLDDDGSGEIPTFGPETDKYKEQVASYEEALEGLIPLLSTVESRMAALGLTTKGASFNLIELMKLSNEEGTQGLGAFYSNMLEGAKEGMETFAGANNPVTKYFEVITEQLEKFSLKEITDKETGDLRVETWAEAFERVQIAIGGAKSAADEWKQSLANATRMAIDNAQEVDKLLLGVQGRSTEGRMEDTLKNEMLERLKTSMPTRAEEFNKMGRDEALAWAIGFGETQKSIGGSFTPAGLVGQQGTDYRERNEQLFAQIALFDSLDKKKRAQEAASIRHAIKEQKLIAGTTKLVAARLKLTLGIEKNALELINIKTEEAEINGLINQYGLDHEIIGWRGEEQQIDRLEILKLQREQIAAQTTELEKQLDHYEQLKRAADSALESGLTKTFSQLLKNEEKSLPDALKKLAEGVFNGIADSIAKQASEWIMRKDPLKPFVDGATIVADAIVEAFRKGSAMIGGGVGGPEGESKFTEDQTTRFTALFGDKIKKPGAGSGKPIEQITATAPRDHSGKGGFGHLLQSFETLFDGFFKPGADWIGKLGTFFGAGEDSFLHGLGDIFGGFKDIFMNILGDKDSGVIGFISGLFTTAAAADGAIFKGGFRKFARGGIVNSPTLGLIGEGRHNEAVVPLPNGKAIPVDMRSSAQNNSIVVNVSSDGQTETEGGTDNEGLGRAIAKAVQEELQNQKRSGGILNRYGTA